jgi:hypothetical protein
MRTHPYEYTYANPTPMSTFEWLNTGRSGDSRSHQWNLVVDGNVAYYLTYNAGKSWKIQGKVKADLTPVGLQTQSQKPSPLCTDEQATLAQC